MLQIQNRTPFSNSQNSQNPPLARSGGASRGARVAFLVSSWLGNRAPTTVRAYQSDLTSWAGWMGMEPAEAVEVLLGMDAGDANALGMAYRAAMREEGLSPATINRRLSALRSIVKAAKVAGLVGWDLMVEAARQQAYRDTRGPGVEGYRAMVATLGDDLQGRRDRAILSLLYTMALRRAEVIGLDLEDLEVEGGRLWITGKGYTEKEAVSVPSGTMEALLAWLEVRGDSPGPLFLSMDRRHRGEAVRPTLNAITRRVRVIGEGAGVRVTPHALRHSGITRALDLTGGDVRRVRALSRHAKLDTLMRYDDARRDAGGEVASLLAEDA
jgi:integrase/recombinase XerC